MPVFEYSALDKKGKAVKGVLDADSTQDVRQKLRTSNVFPISINEARDTTIKKERSLFSIRRAFAHVKSSSVAMMTRQLATLVGAGLPLVSAIDALIPQLDSPALKKNITHIKDQIVEGQSFADALSLYPDIFSAIYINMVRAGETSGTLEIVLDRLADIAEKQQALNRRIRAASAYPILMSLIGAFVLFFLLTYIVPSITTIFAEMNQVLPAPTRFLIITSALFKSFWWVILLAAAGLLTIYNVTKNTKAGRFPIDKITLLLPGIGSLAKKMAVARFSRTLGSLLENGVPMMPALAVVENIPGNALISKSIKDAAQEVEKGKNLSASLNNGGVFPMLSIQMVQVGEQSGQLESMLYKVAEVYENEVESSIMWMTSLLEPIMILVMGAIVGFIVVSICLPIFEMNQLIR